MTSSLYRLQRTLAVVDGELSPAAGPVASALDLRTPGYKHISQAPPKMNLSQDLLPLNWMWLEKIY